MTSNQAIVFNTLTGPSSNVLRNTARQAILDVSNGAAGTDDTEQYVVDCMVRD